MVKVTAGRYDNGSFYAIAMECMTGDDVPPTLGGEETVVEALTRCKRQMLRSRDKWTDAQKERAVLLFEAHPKLKEAHGIVNTLRGIFKDKGLAK